MLIPNSQFIPPLPFPFGTNKFIFYVCEFISGNKIILSFFKDSTSKRYPMIFVFLCVIYLTWRNTLWAHPFCCEWYYCIHFYG